MEESGPRLIFVYGTLKIGQPNNFRMNDTSNGDAKFLGKAQTIDKYPLIIANSFNTPYVLCAEGEGKHVWGEIYEVDAKMCAVLDQLESHPNYYTRGEIAVRLVDGKELRVWIYFLRDFKPELLSREYYEDYDSNGSHGLCYIPRNDRSQEHRDNPRLAWSEVKLNVDVNM